MNHFCGPNPGMHAHRFGLFPFRSPLLWKSFFIFFSSGYLDVSVHRVPSVYLWIQYTVHGVCPCGFPHSEICGSLDICSLPQLIAAYHVFRRLLVPRHPPCALYSLTYCVECGICFHICSHLTFCFHMSSVTCFRFFDFHCSARTASICLFFSLMSYHLLLFKNEFLHLLQLAFRYFDFQYSVFKVRFRMTVSILWLIDQSLKTKNFLLYIKEFFDLLSLINQKLLFLFVYFLLNPAATCFPISSPI